MSMFYLQVIMVDFNDKSVQLNPRNILKVKKWMGNDDDRSLVDLAMLLKGQSARVIWVNLLTEGTPSW